jgi:peptidoglycan/LPS O-acetylase OafA/YrhL
MSTDIDRAPRPPAYLPALDGLRGIAILLVVPHNVNLGASGIVRVITYASGAGWIGVQLFFVLSGFLITGNLLDSLGAKNYYRAFYARRVLRIFPLYYGYLIAILILVPALGMAPTGLLDSRQHQVWVWTFLSNWGVPTVRGFEHFWSLAVEEQFYLVWPLLVALCVRRLVPLCLAFAACAFVFRTSMLALGADVGSVYAFTISRMDALALGAAVAVIVRAPTDAIFARVSAKRLGQIAAGLLLVGFVVTTAYRPHGLMTLTVGHSMLAVAFAIVIFTVATGTAGRWQAVFTSPLLMTVGKYSYGMYVLHLGIDLLWQQPILDLLAWTGAWRPAAYMVVIPVLSFAAAFLSFHLLEKHFLRLKRYFVPIHAREGSPAS